MTHVPTDAELAKRSLPELQALFRQAVQDQTCEQQTEHDRRTADARCNAIKRAMAARSTPGPSYGGRPQPIGRDQDTSRTLEPCAPRYLPDAKGLSGGYGTRKQ